MLRRAGFDVRVIDIEAAPADIVDEVIAAQPVLVGFSLIFQYYIRRYGDLMMSLRAAGVHCHFTMGGHYPSLNPQATLEAVPELDSVVQFEGETTLLELIEALLAGENWRILSGVIHLQDGRCVVNKARRLTEDLDTLPFPDRDFAPTEILGRRGMPLLASRGCARTCSFCSIHTFYRTAPGKVVRLRKTTEVVREKCHLLGFSLRRRRASLERDRPGVGLLPAGDDREQGGLARPRAAGDREDLAAGDGEVDAVQYRHRPGWCHERLPHAG